MCRKSKLTTFFKNWCRPLTIEGIEGRKHVCPKPSRNSKTLMDMNKRNDNSNVVMFYSHLNSTLPMFSSGDAGDQVHVTSNDATGARKDRKSVSLTSLQSRFVTVTSLDPFSKCRCPTERSASTSSAWSLTATNFVEGPNEDNLTESQANCRAIKMNNSHEVSQGNFEETFLERQPEIATGLSKSKLTRNVSCRFLVHSGLRLYAATKLPCFCSARKGAAGGAAEYCTWQVVACSDVNKGNLAPSGIDLRANQLMAFICRPKTSQIIFR